MVLDGDGGSAGSQRMPCAVVVRVKVMGVDAHGFCINAIQVLDGVAEDLLSREAIQISDVLTDVGPVPHGAGHTVFHFSPHRDQGRRLPWQAQG